MNESSSHRTPQQVVREAVAHLASKDDSGEFDPVLMARRVTNALLKSDEFVRLFAREYLPDVAYQACVFYERQHTRVTASTEHVPKKRKSREQLIREVRAEIEERHVRWDELINGQLKPVVSMNRAELMAVSTDYHDVSIAMMQKAEVLRIIAERLTGDQVVSDVWDNDAIKQLWARVRVSFVSSLQREEPPCLNP